MGNKITNASQLPKRYFGLHMVEGVAEYKQPNGEKPLRIFIGENAIKDMNTTYEGCPVVVNHLNEDYDPKDQNETDGVVVKSFYNEVDGKNWVEFMVSSDLGHQKISQGWKLSNAYFQKSHGPKGDWHGVPYDKEVTRGQYEHLAIVENPRYAESVILTPEQFKEYCERKRDENKKLSNSKEKEETKTKGYKSMFTFFKKTKVENSIETDLNEVMVTLGKSQKEMSIESGLKLAEKFINMNGYANGDHMVKDDDGEEMSVNEMSKKYSELKNKMKNMEDEEKKKENSEEDEEDKKKENESDEEFEKRKNSKKKNEETDKAGKDDLEKDGKDDKAKNSKDGGHYEKLMNAKAKSSSKPQVANTMTTGLAKGKSNY